MINAIRKNIFKVIQADEDGLESEGVFLQDGLIQRHKSGPYEKHQGDENLRSNKKIRQDFVFKDDALFHWIGQKIDWLNG
jgi:hypothetical protein